VNIDAALVRGTAGADTDMVQLENGCACCSAGDDLLGALEHLLKTSPGLQHIVVEVRETRRGTQ
jgi:G3E family GTPase